MWSTVWSIIKGVWTLINFLPTVIKVCKAVFAQVKKWKEELDERARIKKAKEAIEKAKKDKDTQDIEDLY